MAGAIIFIVCLPVTVLFNGWLNTANTWAVRWRQFNQVAANEFIRVTGTMGVQILTGFAKAGSVGLMTGQACGTALAYIRDDWRGTLGELRARAKRTSWRRMRLVAWSYRDFALFQTPKAAISVSSRNLPPILLGALYDATITGARRPRRPRRTKLTSIRCTNPPLPDGVARQSIAACAVNRDCHAGTVAR